MNLFFYLEISLVFVGLSLCHGFQVSRRICTHDHVAALPPKFILPMSAKRKTFDEPPYLALITELDACVNDERTEATFRAIVSATKSSKVKLVSIRLTKPSDENFGHVLARALSLTKRLVQLAENSHSFRVVCSSDWVELAGTEGQAHGVHVKESHLQNIPEIRQNISNDDFLIGTSTHSVQSAIQSYTTYFPDYYFVGTCFLTASHPEKTMEELEGPALPGKVRNALSEEAMKLGKECPIVFGIGGIDENNCHIPIGYGADGVAVIRAILQAPNPMEVAFQIHDQMKSAAAQGLVDLQ